MFEKNKKQNKKGFTLMEVMVAMSVIIIGLTAALGLIAFTISSGTQDKNRLIAINLAQEGIELVRNIRDNNWRKIATGEYNEDNWNKDIRNEHNKRIDYNDYDGTGGFNFDGQCKRTQLKIDNDGFYSYDNGTPTVFNRCIDISQGNPSNPLKVISTVTVDDNKSKYDVTVVAYLYDWKK